MATFVDATPRDCAVPNTQEELENVLAGQLFAATRSLDEAKKVMDRLGETWKRDLRHTEIVVRVGRAAGATSNARARLQWARGR